MEGGKQETKMQNLLWFIYPVYLFILGYFVTKPRFTDDDDYNLGMIIGSIIWLTIIPWIISLVRKILKKKKLPAWKNLLIYYGISFIVFLLFFIGSSLKSK